MKLNKQTILFTIAIAAILYMVGSLFALLNSVRISLNARHEVATVLEAVEARQFDRALVSLFVIEDRLNRARSWQRPSSWLGIVPVLRHDYAVYSDLLGAGSKLSTSLKSVIQYLAQGSLSQELSLAALDLKVAPAAYLSIHDDVMDSFDHLLDAADEIEKIHIGFIPAQYRDEMIELQDELISNRGRIEMVKQYLEMMPYLLGQHDPQEILVLLQNPHELRPTGGFIGNYGRMTIDKGNITQFFTDDIYNLEGKVLGQETLIPPEPIKIYNVVEYWYLRDSNWSPDYPTAVQDILNLYEFESGENNIDTVIAFTPMIIEEFLKITGPVEVDNIEFTAENLVEAIQYRVEQEYWRIGLTNEERKIVVNHLAQALKQRLFALNEDEISLLWQALNRVLDQNEILIHASSPSVQKFIVDQGWDGSIVDTTADYLYVVDANLGALKTDRVVVRSRDYRVEQQADGKWKARLRLTYQNNGFFDYRTTRYRTYTRIYVPIGSELISHTGFMKTDKSNEFVEPLVYSEFDKTVIAGFLSVEPSQQRYIEIEYFLPPWLEQAIRENNRYDLYLQKQPGLADTSFSGTVISQNDLYSFAPSDIDYQTVGEKGIRYSVDFVQDTEVVVKFRNP